MATETPIRSNGNLAPLFKALSAFQGEVQNVEKTKTAKVAGSSKSSGKSYSYTFRYADLADVFPTIREPLSKHGLSTLQPTVIDGDQLKIVTRLAHESGAWIESDYPVSRVGGLAHQDMGAALTYAKRYALCSLLGIASEEDTDTEGGGQTDVMPDDENPAPSAARNGPPRQVPAVDVASGFQKRIEAAADIPSLEAIRREIGAAKLAPRIMAGLETDYYHRKAAILEQKKPAPATTMTDEQWESWVQNIVHGCATIDSLSEAWTTRVEPTLEGRSQDARKAALAEYQARERQLTGA